MTEHIWSMTFEL